MAAVIGLGLFASTDGHAAKVDKEQTKQQQLEQWSAVVAELNAHRFSSETTREISLIQTWMSRGEALLASGNGDQVDRLLDRIAAVSEFVKARHARLGSDEWARRAEGQAYEREMKAQAATRRANQAAEKERALEARGL